MRSFSQLEGNLVSRACESRMRSFSQLEGNLVSHACESRYALCKGSPKREVTVPFEMVRNEVTMEQSTSVFCVAVSACTPAAAVHLLSIIQYAM